MHRAGAEPGQFCRLDYARSLCQLLACPIKLVGLGSCPAQPFPDLAGLAHKLAVAFDLGLDAQAGPDALADHRAFEFGEGAGHLEQQLARRSGGIDRLLVEIEIDTDCFEMLDRAEQ